MQSSDCLMNNDSYSDFAHHLISPGNQEILSIVCSLIVWDVIVFCSWFSSKKASAEAARVSVSLSLSQCPDFLDLMRTHRWIHMHLIRIHCILCFYLFLFHFVSCVFPFPLNSAQVTLKRILSSANFTWSFLMHFLEQLSPNVFHSTWCLLVIIVHLNQCTEIGFPGSLVPDDS